MATKDFKFYYKFLMKTFGHAEYAGCKALAHILEDYNPNENMQAQYTRYANSIGSTPTAVERVVRTYLKQITIDYNLEDLSVMLDYAFRPNQTKLRAAEFIPVLKFALDNEEE